MRGLLANHIHTESETAIKEVHENTEQMRVFNELKLNQLGDSKDGLVGNV